MRIAILTLFAMLAFAANSVIARIALSEAHTRSPLIDPANYSVIRLISGAIVLGVLVGIRHNAFKKTLPKGNWFSAACLFLYAASFSFSYVLIDTGLGALILFACVQLTMFGWAIFQGERLRLWEIIGVIIAFSALIWLVFPGIEAPSPVAAALMAISGIAWGIYSINGRKSNSPLENTAGNFILTIPMAFALAIAASFFSSAPFSDVTLNGLALSILSGAITSGLGYAVWYYVLPNLTTTKAAISQLSVPVLAGIGGSLLLGEAWTPRFTIASALILGGVALAIFSKRKPTS